MSTRREIMKLLGVAPVAITSSAPKLAEILASPSALAAQAAATVAQAGMPIGASNGLGAIIGRQAEGLLRSMEDERYIRCAVRFGGLDGDIASFRSISRAAKERMQILRDTADQDLMRKARTVLWWHP